MSIKEALAHIDLNFLNVFFSPLADDFNIQGWAEWALFPPFPKQGEMPGNYLLDPTSLAKPHAGWNGAVVKTV